MANLIAGLQKPNPYQFYELQITGVGAGAPGFVQAVPGGAVMRIQRGQSVGLVFVPAEFGVDAYGRARWLKEAEETEKAQAASRKKATSKKAPAKKKTEGEGKDGGDSGKSSDPSPAE